MKKKLFIISICFLLFGCSKNNSYKYRGNIYDDSYGYKNKYCYNYFLENNSNQAKLYSDIYLTATEFNHKNPNISASGNEFYILFKANCKKYDLSLNDTRQVFDMFQYDNPEFFYLSEIDYKDNGNYVSFEIYKDYYKKEERNRLYSLIIGEMNKVDKVISNIDNDFDRLMFIYNYVIDNMDFSIDDEDNPNGEYWAHNIVGFFERNEGVCETYTKTFSLLLNKYNFSNFAAFSTDHVWNVVEVCNEWFMFDLTYDLFGLCEEEFYIESEIKHKYDDVMIKLPKMATSSLSLSNMILYEDGVEIYRSHSIDDIYSKFDGGNYEIVLDAINARNIFERKFPINYINTNYNSLKIVSNYSMKDYIENLYYTFMILTGDLVIEKDVTIEKISLADRDINYGRTGALKNPFEVIVKDGATLYINYTNVSGKNVVIIDE